MAVHQNATVLLEHDRDANVVAVVAVATGAAPAPAVEGGTAFHDWYVSTTGSGDGSLANPWSLATAFAGAAGQIHPGDTVWLRGGTYTGAHHQITVSGTAGNLVTFRGYPGERAILDGGANKTTDVVSWRCTYAALRGLTITSSATDRTGSDDTSYAEFDSPHTGVQNDQDPGQNYGTGCKIINCVIKNLGGGISTWSTGTNTEIYGNIIYYHGWNGTAGHSWGVGYYTQNIDPSTRIFRDNILFGNNEYAVQAYGETALLDNHTFEGNIIFADGVIRTGGSTGAVSVGGGSEAPTGNVWSSNAVYGAQDAGVVSFERGNESLVCQSNLHGYAGTNGGEFNLTTQTGTPVVTGNKIYSGLIQPAGYRTTWPMNEYYRWSQDYGGEDAKPTGTWTLVRPNQYEAGRGHVAIFNWDHTSSVNVNVSTILEFGQTYAIYHAMDPEAATPLATGTFDGGTISFPMLKATLDDAVEAPTNATTPASCGPEFAAFIVVATGAVPPEGWFVAVNGRSDAAGTFNDPWDIQTAGYGGPGGTSQSPASYVQPGDTVWIRGGTYTAPLLSGPVSHFDFSVLGTEQNPITFRGYPGERAILDGNWQDIIGDNAHIVSFTDYFSGAVRGYMILQDVEITHSLVNRLTGVWADGTPRNAMGVGPQRTFAFKIVAPHCKIINCIIHDAGMGGFTSSYGPGWEVYGNLISYSGFYWPMLEQNEAVSVDLVPAGATAVARSGTWKAQQAGAANITISNHNNTGDYTLVAVGKNGLGYADITAYFGTDLAEADRMTLLVGVDGYSKSVAMFGIKGHAGTATIYVHSGSTTAVRALAQSFVNVAQNADEKQNAVPGTFTVADGAMSLNGTTLTSATGAFTANHVGQPIEVAGAGISGGTLKTYVDSYTNPTTLELVDTSYADVTGKAVTIRGGTWWNNQWGDALWRKDGSQPASCWNNAEQAGVAGQEQYISFYSTTPSDTNHMVVDAMNIYGSYGSYYHAEGDNTYSVSDAAMSSGSTTLTSTTGGFTVADHQGLPIRVVGAGAGGAVLYSTITTVSNGNTLVLQHPNASGAAVSGKRAVVHKQTGPIYSPPNNPLTMMSWGTRTGPGLLNMRWGWTPKLDIAGHGLYSQGGTHGVMTTTANDPTVHSGDAMFRPNYEGAAMRILGAGEGGLDLFTTIATYVNTTTVTLNPPYPGATLSGVEGIAYYPQRCKHNIFWDQWYEGIQVYGSSDACSVGNTLEENFWFNNTIVLGGLPGFRLTDSIFRDNFAWDLTTNIGYDTRHMRNFRVTGNYLHHDSQLPIPPENWDTMVIQSNTFIGTTNTALSNNFTSNFFLTSDPTSNHIVLLPNEYESNRAIILVYNWENLSTVDVNISNAVTVGTPIYVLNSRNYFGTPVWSGIYTGGAITLPMTGTAVEAVADVICENSNPLAVFTPRPTTAPAFMAFIVRSKIMERWRE